MASKEINDFTAKDPVVGTDEALIQETAGGTTKKTLISTIKNFIFKQINAYAAKGTIVDSDEFIIQETGGGANKKVLASVIKTYAGSLPYLHIQDQKTSGTNGGSSSSGNNIRVLNVVVTNTITGASLSSNQITLSTGTYRIMSSAPSFQAGPHVSRLYNVTDVAYVGTFGQNEQAGGSDSVSTRSMIVGIFTIASSKTFELHHNILNAKATTGLGVAHSVTTEIYSDVQIWKIG